MSPGLSIAFLLLSTTLMSWTFLEVKAEEEEGFTVGRADQYKEDGGIPGACGACKGIISRIQKKLGKESSKEKIGQLLNNVCKQLKELIRSMCKKLVNKYKDKLIDLLIKKGTPTSICTQLNFCKKDKSECNYHK